MNDATDQSKSHATDWWVVVTKPRGEARAQVQLELQGFSTYLPRFAKETIRQRQRRVSSVPLFPRYLFVLADAHAHHAVHTIRSTLGVSQLLKVGEQPVRMPSTIVEGLRLLEAGHGGKIDGHFQHGDRVTLLDGPFKGLKGIYQIDSGELRGLVLLEILQKTATLTADKSQLKKI